MAFRQYTSTYVSDSTRMLYAIVATLALCATTVASTSSATIPVDEHCFSGALAGFAWLSDYDPAVSYCLNLYPHAATTRTLCALPSDEELTSSSETRSDTRDLFRRHDLEAIYDNLLDQRQSTIEAVCWCIASSQTTTTIAECREGQYCDSKRRTCKAMRNCQNPARCDPASLCSSSSSSESSNACYCHPDVDNPSEGYCMGNGPPGSPCPEVFEDCSSNSDCGGAKVCILACCRKESFCVEVVDYDCANALSPSRLFRRNYDPVGYLGINPK